jgi:hypothetical protein
MNVKSIGEEKSLNKNQRHNRPRKKEIPQEKWDQDFEDIRKKYEHGGQGGKPDQKDAVQEDQES